MKHLDGHVWGDRYWSKVLEGEPPEETVREENGGEGKAAEAGEQNQKARPREGPPGGDSHREGKTLENTRLPPILPRSATPEPASGDKLPHLAAKPRF
jgi:hypothetical protein